MGRKHVRVYKHQLALGMCCRSAVVGELFRFVLNWHSSSGKSALGLADDMYF